MADIEKWITINGTHIPIIKGESRARAVANFIKSKKERKRFKNAKSYGSKESIAELRKQAKASKDELKRTPNIDDRDEHNLLTSWEKASIKAGQDQEDVDRALRYRRSLNKTIKGYGKTDRMKAADKEYARESAKNERRYQKEVEKNLEYDRTHELYKDGTNELTRAGKFSNRKWEESATKRANYEKYNAKQKARAYTQKLKEDRVYKKKQYDTKKSITTPSGYYSPKELHERENRLNNLYINYWNGKMDVFTLMKKQDQLIKSGKATRNEIAQSQLEASALYNYGQKAHAKKVSIKGFKRRILNTKK